MTDFTDIVITDIEDVITISAYTGRNVRIENRKYYGLSFCKSGKITYTHNGEKIVSTTDKAIILPQNASYELFNNQGGEFPLINFYCENNDLINTFISIPISNIDGYLKDFERLKNYCLSEDNRLKSVSVLYDILHRLSIENKDSGGVVTRAKKYIDKNISDVSLSNVTLAEFIGVSEIYLRKLFKEKYNTTPKQYIIDMRIKLAKRLLFEEHQSITSVSASCGFSGVYHFCRAFKNKTGITPSEYRRIYKFNGI